MSDESHQPHQPLQGDLLSEQVEFDLLQLCRICSVTSETVRIYVEEGVIDPVDGNAGTWRFQSSAVSRLRIAVRLSNDLGVNPAGAALALDLLDELQVLRARLDR